jgi:hypothetical protein
LAAFRSWVGNYLPVVCEGLASPQIRNDGSYEGYGEEDVQVAEISLMGALPDGFCESAKEHRYTEFDCPETDFVSVVLI